MQPKPDIFDRIFSWRILGFARPFYLKYKQALLYLFFGALTTAVSLGSFALFTLVIPCDELIANIISWLLAVLFAFLTNRTWVFQSTDQSFGRQMLTFYLGRVSTLLVEEALILIFVKWLLWDAMAVKIAAQIIVLILNYVISKLFVFKP